MLLSELRRRLFFRFDLFDFQRNFQGLEGRKLEACERILAGEAVLLVEDGKRDIGIHLERAHLGLGTCEEHEK